MRSHEDFTGIDIAVDVRLQMRMVCGNVRMHPGVSKHIQARTFDYECSSHSLIEVNTSRTRRIVSSHFSMEGIRAWREYDVWKLLIVG